MPTVASWEAIEVYAVNSQTNSNTQHSACIRALSATGEAIENYDDFKNLFITPVWGEEFIREFLEISLPTQLSSKNLGALRPLDNVYCIVTSESGKKDIETSAIFRTLTEYASVQFIVYDDMSVSKNNNSYDLMHDMYNSSLAYVKSEINCFFLSADIFCSDGLFASAIAAMEAGKKVVFVPTVRVSKESFNRSVLQSRITSPTPDETVELILSHEQVMTKAGLVNEPSGAIFSLPSHTGYRLHNGYVGRWNVMHPLVVRLLPNPPKIDLTVDWNYGVLDVSRPDEIEVFWDSDDGLVLTTAPEDYAQGGSIVYHGTDKMRTENLIRWLSCGWALKIHVLQMDGIVCLHSGPIDQHEYAKGIDAIDRVWKPFRDVISKYATRPDPNYNKSLNDPAIPRGYSGWLRLRLDPVGIIKGVFRRIARKLA
jgi:hypothetical protein